MHSSVETFLPYQRVKAKTASIYQALLSYDDYHSEEPIDSYVQMLFDHWIHCPGDCYQYGAANERDFDQPPRL